MLKLAIRRVLTERPYRSVPELAFLLNSSERTIRRKIQEIPDVAGVRFKKQILYFLKDAVPVSTSVEIAVRVPQRQVISGHSDLTHLAGCVAATFGCSKQAAQVFLISYAAWARREENGCAYDGAVGSLLNVAGDLFTVRRACSELCRAGLFRADAEDPFTRTGHATGRFVEEIWKGRV